jgi:fatty acid-binding protein DegV
VIPLGKLRTRHKARENLAERVRALGPLESLAVMHVSDPDGAQAMAERLAPQSARPPIVGEITAVIGTHVGPGTIGVGPVLAA